MSADAPRGKCHVVNFLAICHKFLSLPPKEVRQGNALPQVPESSVWSPVGLPSTISIKESRKKLYQPLCCNVLVLLSEYVFYV